jgi:hypothetical protein
MAIRLGKKKQADLEKFKGIKFNPFELKIQ